MVTPEAIGPELFGRNQHCAEGNHAYRRFTFKVLLYYLQHYLQLG